ncbi:MAG: type II secretion system protein GspN [Candidatus Binatia bacterium]|nr:type II secretion system protein GspN [Candidatus Binatia bacterium]
MQTTEKRLRDRLLRLLARSGWALYTLACFCLFLCLTFPSDLLLQRVVAAFSAESAVRIRYATGDLTWWGGLELNEVTLEASGIPSLPASRVILTLPVLGVLRGSLSPLTFQVHLAGGTVDGSIRKDGERFGLRFGVHHLALERWPLPHLRGQGRVAGQVTADGELEGSWSSLPSLRGSLRATLRDGLLRTGSIPGVPIPPVQVQSLDARVRATLADGRVDIAELVLHTDGIEAIVQGTVVLRTPWERSGLDLQVTAKVTGSPSPALTTLLSFLPVSPDSPHERRAAISGSLAAPLVR